MGAMEMSELAEKITEILYDEISQPFSKATEAIKARLVDDFKDPTLSFDEEVKSIEVKPWDPFEDPVLHIDFLAFIDEEIDDMLMEPEYLDKILSLAIEFRKRIDLGIAKSISNYPEAWDEYGEQQ